MHPTTDGAFAIWIIGARILCAEARIPEPGTTVAVDEKTICGLVALPEAVSALTHLVRLRPFFTGITPVLAGPQQVQSGPAGSDLWLQGSRNSNKLSLLKIILEDLAYVVG